ncbi:MAG TPA: AAA family ATPase [Candidatus Polarisedimenticolia bacterium]
MAIYLGFFGLKKNPFGATPDPEFLYLSHAHREALAQLTYAIQERKGFILLTAEVGTGKTTLLHTLRSQLDGNTAVAYVANSMLPFRGILEYMLEEFEIAKPGETPAQQLVTLQTFLLDRHRAGQGTVLILDEAQNFYPQTLEQIRLLSNFETTKEKILQILLVGQPELRARLEMPELRQLSQRIGLRCSIPPLNPIGTRNYIRTRLRIAGARDSLIFTDRALARIAEYASGIPRIINTLCDHCLLIGYADQTRRIDREIVDEAITYLEDGLRPRRRARVAARRSRNTPHEIVDEAVTHLEDGLRPRRPARVAARGSRNTPLRWGLIGTGAGLVAGTIGLAAFQPDALWQAYDASAALLSYLVHSARTWLGR